MLWFICIFALYKLILIDLFCPFFYLTLYKKLLHSVTLSVLYADSYESHLECHRQLL